MATYTKLEKNEKGLPEMVEFYNETKFGVNIAKKYGMKSGSRRQTLQVFFNILDLAGINAWILYKETTGEQISRKDFIFQLADEVSIDNEKSWIEQRASEIQSTSKNSPYSRKWRQIGYCNNNKTTTVCNLCKKNMYAEGTRGRTFTFVRNMTNDKFCT